MMRKFFMFLPLFVLIGIGIWYVSDYDKSFKRLWISADKEAQQLEAKGKVEKALTLYENKLNVGAIYYKRGDFVKALEVYEESSTKEAFFNRGNVFVMLGKYNEAIDNYKLVLEIEPSNIKAQENMKIAQLRQAELDKFKGKSAGTTNIGADKIVYDNKSNKGDAYKEEGKKKGGTQQWLDRLETSPGNFLRAKFSYQYYMQQKGKK